MAPSFIGDIYFKMMGMKIGKGAQIVSPVVNDCYMVEVGAKTIIGGGAVINGHLFEKDGIHLAPVKIGSRCVIGTNAQVNPPTKEQVYKSLVKQTKKKRKRIEKK